MATALITGASTGIGYELTKLFARDTHNVVLVARNASKLTHIAEELKSHFGIDAKAIPLDLTAPHAPTALFEQITGDRIQIDFLVNNAGYGIRGNFVYIPMEESLGQIHLNITALTALTRLFLPSMVERRSGRVLNVASTAGFQPGPLMAVYYATKAYVISFSEAIANELKDTGVTVTCLCPGATDTEFQKRAGSENSILFRKIPPMDARTVAEDGYRAMMTGKSLVISGLRNRLLAESVRFGPRKLVTAISRKVLEQAN